MQEGQISHFGNFVLSWHPSTVRTKINYSNPFLQISEFALDPHTTKIWFAVIALGWVVLRISTLFQSYRPFTSMYNSFLKYLTLTNKAVGTVAGYVRTLLELTGSWSSSPLIVCQDAFGPEIAPRWAEHSLQISLDIFDIQFLLP